MSIALCLITKNEERNIVQCIESFEDLVDQIVVVDTGSVDKTKTLALRKGASVFDFKWNDSFANARNECLSHVKTEWCLFVDADERLEYVNLFELQQAIRLEKVISVKLKTNQSEIEKIKLWKVGQKFRYVLPVHEFLDVKGDGVFYLDSFIIKNKSFVNPEELVESRKNYIRILENYISSSDNNKYFDRCYFYLCADSFFVGDYVKAYSYGKKYIKLNDRNSYFSGKIYYYMGELELMNGRNDSAKRYIEEAYRILGNLKILHEVYSHILYNLGDLQGAVKYYKKLNE
jgi:glycosyltransferase involved in cell wall biosynthesis